MGKKIEGLVNPKVVDEWEARGYIGVFDERCALGAEVKATLVIGDEPVFTESEVRAMFREAIAKRYDYRESTDIVEAYDIELIANKYGIDLDLDGNLEPKTP